MSYVNGKEVLPDNILSEVQKYFGGGLIYIPLPENERCKWGSRTNTELLLEVAAFCVLFILKKLRH